MAPAFIQHLSLLSCVFKTFLERPENGTGTLQLGPKLFNPISSLKQPNKLEVVEKCPEKVCKNTPPAASQILVKHIFAIAAAAAIGSPHTSYGLVLCLHTATAFHCCSNWHYFPCRGT